MDRLRETSRRRRFSPLVWIAMFCVNVEGGILSGSTRYNQGVVGRVFVLVNDSTHEKRSANGRSLAIIFL